MRSENPICAPSRFSDVSRKVPWKQFQCSSDWRWHSLVLSRKIIQRFLFPRLSPPGNRWCNVLGFVPVGSVSSSSTLQIFRDASHLWGLLCPPVYLLGHFPSLWHVQENIVMTHSCHQTNADDSFVDTSWQLSEYFNPVLLDSQMLLQTTTREALMSTFSDQNTAKGNVFQWRLPSKPVILVFPIFSTGCESFQVADLEIVFSSVWLSCDGSASFFPAEHIPLFILAWSLGTRKLFVRNTAMSSEQNDKERTLCHYWKLLFDKELLRFQFISHILMALLIFTKLYWFQLV